VFAVVFVILYLCQGEILFGHLLMRLLLIPHEALTDFTTTTTRTHTNNSMQSKWQTRTGKKANVVTCHLVFALFLLCLL